jgi:hypothetical protein
MADPASLAGLAFGAVSLGIHLCDGIVSYVGAVQGRKAELAAMSERATLIQNTMKSIEIAVPRLRGVHEQSYTALHASISALNEELVQLRTVLEDLGVDVAGPTNLKGKWKMQAKKLGFPFRQDNLDRLNARMDSLDGILNTAIGILELYAPGTERLVRNNDS